jgi:hypothetical protein
MNYLKRFNESNINIGDIEDILLEVRDIGLDAWSNKYYGWDIQKIIGNDKEVIRAYIEHNPSEGDTRKYHFSDIKECVERLIGYMSEFGYKDFIYTDLYTEYVDTNTPNDDEVVAVVRLTFYK